MRESRIQYIDPRGPVYAYPMARVGTAQSRGLRPQPADRHYGKFSTEPFERGFGVTVGNSLRRILLSSLEGSAVTRVKIQGVQHEITTIPGVVEDVTDIVLNVKSLVVKNSSEQPRTLRIDRHEKGVITAANIISDEAVQIVNPEHILATLTDDVPFVMEMTVENGRGYRTADENAGREREIR